MKMLSGVSNQEITYNEFLEKVDAGEVKSVEINDDQINIVPKSEESDNPVSYTHLPDHCRPGMGHFHERKAEPENNSGAGKAQGNLRAC